MHTHPGDILPSAIRAHSVCGGGASRPRCSGDPERSRISRGGLCALIAVALCVAASACGGGGGGGGGGDTTGVPDGGRGELGPDARGLDARDAAGDEFGMPEFLPPPEVRDDAPDAPDVPRREFSAPCAENDDCISGWCVPGPNGYVCSMTCETGCPDGWECRLVSNTRPDFSYICVPSQGRLCEPCTVDGQCGGGLCLAFLEGQACGRPCETGNDCPVGFGCVEATSVEAPATRALQCVPTSGRCDCNGENDGAVRPCSVANEFGQCWGSEICDASVGWLPCSAPAPEAEHCDGRDNDCDGPADEELSAPTEMCEQVNELGRCTGEWQCQGTAGFVCTAPLPSAETCDYRDNNCDGTVDEGFREPDTGRYVLLEHCGGCGNDCTGRFPHGTAMCDGSAAEPRCVVAECETGYYVASPVLCLPASSSLCAPCAQDANCVVPGDRCLALADGSFCGRDCSAESVHGSACPAGMDCLEVSSGVFQCAPATASCTCYSAEQAGRTRPCERVNEAGRCTGLSTCDPTFGGWSACDAPEPAVDLCDGFDNDCDGTLDEDAAPPDAPCLTEWTDPVDGVVHRCSGDWICGPAPDGETRYWCTAPVAGPEVCNGRDDNCDGTTDEGFRDPETGFYGLPDHCGLCNYRCADAVLFATETTCRSDASGAYCVPLACEPGYAIPPQNERICIAESGPSDCQRCTVAEHCTGLPGGACTSVDGSGQCTRECAVEGDCLTGFVCTDGRCLPESGSCACLADDAGTTRPCFVTGSEGTCVGVELCDPAVGWVDCDAPVPSPETCNGLDDDCDGLIDEELSHEPALCTIVVPDIGECPGVWGCTGDGPADGWTCLGHVPELETCDYVDNDCNGSTDEGFALYELCAVGAGACLRRGFTRCTADGSGVTCDAVPGTGGPEACNGLDDDCDSQTDEELYGADCALQAGVCAGARSLCAGTAGYPPCVGPEYGPLYEAEEASCDGRDNDCDGDTDETLPATPCDLATGVCAGRVKTCGGLLGWLPCAASDYGTAYELDEATCDYQDNDCDGLTDEAFLVDGRYGHPLHCGACGISCVGALPHATSRCDVAADPPRCVVDTCDPAFVAISDRQCVPMSLGLCDPCVTVDNCLIVGAACASLVDGQFCVNPCSEARDCPPGYTCSERDGGSYCVPATGGCLCDGSNPSLRRGCEVPYPETGEADYFCLGVQTCTESGWSSCVLEAESCNLLDDDCDGLVDEGFTDVAGRYTADRHCGQCGNDCTLLLYEGRVGVCNALVDPPVCSVACGPNCFDVNANPTDGCECCNPAAFDFPDEGGLDADCDGIDGERSNAIFVAKDGSDENDGFYGRPKLTIEAGIQAALDEGLRDVYVATGIYAESLVLPVGIALYGGYRGDFRRRDPIAYEVALFPSDVAADRPGTVNAIEIAGGPAGSTVLAGFSIFGLAEARPGASSYAVYVRNCDATLRLSENRIFGGRGGDGARGSDGGDGTAGGAGSAGIAALDLYAAYGVSGHACLPVHHSAGGTGGQGSCAAVAVAGGAGGNRVCPTYDGDSTGVPVASENGTNGQNGGALGGAAGRDVYHQRFQCEGYNTYGPVEGGNGTDGAAGASGLSGGGCADRDGSVLAGVFVPAAGNGGGSGAAGGGGGGGGSGGGAYSEDSCFSKGYGWDNLGGSGGGGGAGGCPGTAGTAGTGGGGAFGIFVVFDAAPLTVPDIRDNEFSGGAGGAGGNGGNGGTGGGGGTGGLGGAGGGTGEEPVGDPRLMVYPAFKGGKGGSGGRGGDGGGGGGGCGGPAIGLFVSNAPAESIEAWRAGNAFGALGTGGRGGEGGFSLGQPGGDGLAGLATSVNF